MMLREEQLSIVSPIVRGPIVEIPSLVSLVFYLSSGVWGVGGGGGGRGGLGGGELVREVLERGYGVYLQWMGQKRKMHRTRIGVDVLFSTDTLSQFGDFEYGDKIIIKKRTKKHHRSAENITEATVVGEHNGYPT